MRSDGVWSGREDLNLRVPHFGSSCRTGLLLRWQPLRSGNSGEITLTDDRGHQFSGRTIRTSSVAPLPVARQMTNPRHRTATCWDRVPPAPQRSHADDAGGPSSGCHRRPSCTMRPTGSSSRRRTPATGVVAADLQAGPRTQQVRRHNVGEERPSAASTPPPCGTRTARPSGAKQPSASSPPRRR